MSLSKIRLKDFKPISYQQQIDVSDGGSSIDVYFDPVNTTMICFNVSSILVNNFEILKPATIKAVDYYNSGKKMEKLLRNSLIKRKFCVTEKQAQVLYSLPDQKKLPDCPKNP